MPRFEKLGPALRYLRLHGGSRPRKQMEIADRAAVTRGMLSSYEKGRREPSLRSLERVLDALDADLVQLEWALRMVSAEAGRAPAPPPDVPDWRRAGEVAEPPAVYRTVRVPEPLSPREEHALGQMIAGFLSYLRYTRDDEGEEPGEDRGDDAGRDGSEEAGGGEAARRSVTPPP